jgi:hypothetical protein
MSEIDTLKDYLVKLGFSTNAAQFRAFQNTLANATKSVQGASHSWESAFKWSAAGAVTALGTIAASTVGLLDSVSKADLGYKLFAMHMFMSETAAKRMKIATDALGYSIEDIIWNPELRGRYEDLMKWQDRLDKNLGKGYAGNMKFIRDIGQEFTKMKVSGVYGMQSLADAIAEKFGGSLKDSKGWLENINEIIMQKTPEWSAKIAGFLSDIKPIYDEIGKAAVEVKKTFSMFDDMLSDGQDISFADRIKKIAGWIGVLTNDFIGLGRAAIVTGQILKDSWKSFPGTVDERVDAKNWASLQKVGDDWTKNHERYLHMATGTSGTVGARGSSNGLQGIGAFESTGNYGAQHPLTGAAGKYQIMPSNWPSWARDAGLSSNASMTPENQELVAQTKWNQYMKQFGGNDQLAATAWFAGPGRAQRLANGDSSILNYTDANNMSVAGYIKGSTGREYSSVTTGDIIINVKTNASAQDIGYEAARQFRMATGSIQ